MTLGKYGAKPVGSQAIETTTATIVGAAMSIYGRFFTTTKLK